MKNTKVISITNLKGGVAKTTTSANMGAGLARLGYTVLMIDWDPQANLTMHFGYDPEQTQTLYSALDPASDDMFDVKKLNPVMIEQYPKHLYLLTADYSLAKFEPIFSNPALGGGGHMVLNNVIDKFRGKVDFVIVDCQPSLSLLTINSYYASDFLLIPAEASKFSTKGMDQILFSLKRMNKNFGKEIKIGGVFLTRVEANTVLSKEYAKYLDGREDIVLMESRIRRNVTIAECQEAGMDIFSYDLEQTQEAKKLLISNGSEDYYNFINEALQIVGVKQEKETARDMTKPNESTEEKPVTKKTAKGDLAGGFKSFLKNNN